MRLISGRTGLLVTTVTSVINGYSWVHERGSQSLQPFVGLGVFSSASLTCDGALRFGVIDSSRAEYTCDYGYRMLDLLARPGVHLHGAGLDIGRALFALHNAKLSSGARRPPRPVARSEGWLSGYWPPLGRILSPYKVSAIREWVRWVVSGNELPLSHGSPGIAHVAVGEVGANASLLVGEDVGRAREVYDVAWVLGELAELHAFRSNDRELLAQARAGFSAGYPGAEQLEGLRTGLAYRIVQHAYDWYHFADGPREQVEGLLMLASSYLNKGKP